ncbi:MAG: nucleotidyl transferase AbiEii/AbiGii toxin family protein [Deltaproteobacteria bacterium]|nr:nucleotidyl transferase AbiEii/AbiGii toxin family protein [Deltaproteobacteria bacterium]
MFEQAFDSRLLLLAGKLFSIADIAERFYLAGGTALAMHLGHRKSDDLDLFSEKEFSIEKLCKIIEKLNGQILIAEQETIHANVEGMKLSLLLYPYKLIKPLQKFDGIRIAGIEDIASMKVVAISQRADKKDFYDLYEIMKHFQPLELKDMFLKKYGRQRINCYHILKSFFYFQDAEDSPDPISLNGTTWDEVKAFFINNERKLTEGLM